ncbi:hypothetical protein HPP92_028125 [Vanilla planifolia]|uniref:EF-hand domain-containing protein n=1 Tax=Vanilla planifolia TaxID=51239 RepID=A0A835P7C8_VANPL|nr:hypothetical protein HPP92_028125 [Vanilla planifolia]KAG0447904.1 hypothetical protein HPP92_028106 [Vanilla planifolia]
MAGAITSSTLAQASTGKLPPLKASLKSPSPSFRLRSSSLNSLRLRRVFDLFDQNGDEEITTEELYLALDRLGLSVDRSDLCTVVSCYIRPGRIGLDFDSFCTLHRDLGDAVFGNDGGLREEEAEMREAFGVFDEDGDGFISAKELQDVLGKLGLNEGRSIEQIKQMIGSVDRDHDGRVDFFEFRSMMKAIAVRT